MDVFLTGATGFIGSHVARRLLSEGHRVTALVRPGSDLRRIADLRSDLDLLEGDVRAAEALEAPLKERAPELCLHLAWYAVPGRYLDAVENVELAAAGIRLLEVLDAVGCARTVIAGTCFEYDHRAGYLSEESPIRPQSLYGAAKHGLFLMSEQFQRARNRSFAWARIFYLYGPWEDRRRMVPTVIGKLLAGEPCPFSPGEQVRDFLHVEDVAAGICALAESELEGPVNVGSSRPVTVAEVATTIARLTGREELLQLGARPTPPGDPPFIVANTERLQRATGWRPRHSLEDGLRQTIEWWRLQLQPSGST
jgi:nucleoside-diphosphate-sugar epimerase